MSRDLTATIAGEVVCPFALFAGDGMLVAAAVVGRRHAARWL